MLCTNYVSKNRDLEAKQSWIYSDLLMSVGPFGPGGGIYSIIEDVVYKVYYKETDLEAKQSWIYAVSLMSVLKRCSDLSFSSSFNTTSRSTSSNSQKSRTSTYSLSKNGSCGKFPSSKAVSVRPFVKKLFEFAAGFFAVGRFAELWPISLTP